MYVNNNTESTKIFPQYIESPIQIFDRYGNKCIDALFITIYSIMMNHQDNAIKQGRAYTESFDSLAYLARCSKRTAQRKVDDLISLNLIEKFERGNAQNLWVVNPISSAIGLVSRETNTERAKRVREGCQHVKMTHQHVKMTHPACQNDTRNSSNNISKEIAVLNQKPESQNPSPLIEDNSVKRKVESTVTEHSDRNTGDKKHASVPLDIDDYDDDLPL